MIGILIVIALAVAAPLAILVFTVKATECERSRSSVSRGVSALFFGVASLLSLTAVDLSISGSKTFSMSVLFMGIAVMVIAALLAFVLHRLIAGSTKIIAALAGGGLALATVLIFALFVALIVAPGKSEGMFVAAFGATMVLVPFGIPLFLLGALVGLVINRMSKKRGAD